ncbi:hypothetical protein KI688_006581 [Linnemannia hyalina]|uniref:Crinkler effector protein N-terminal domain-containing protein n=1 Tax=Linnemannia hyalina TaxID=64524 RepID=A0A9P7XLS7_9FUNG|nr:hypothetical protein KI688_006581 [Linnemannia hyalina]
METMPFSVDIDASKTVDHLKDAIKIKIPDSFKGVDAKDLTLWRVSIPLVPKKDRKDISLSDIPSKEELDETDDLSDVFPDKPPKKTIHIIVQRPPQGSGTSFFAAGSKHAEFLDSYVQGQLQLPTTTSGVRGLPKVLRRGVVESQDSKLNLLLLDLPDPPPIVGLPIPERFRSNVLLRVLDKMQAQDLPVFGVSGCGKTRSMIEMLCLQCGFYFNAAKSDFGSDDLFRLADLIDNKTWRTRPAPTLESKLRVVIGEAQILSDKSPTSLASSSTQGNLRPMLFPVLHAFRLVGFRDELTIIYSGTGLSIRTLRWALSSGGGIKEYGSNTFPTYIEFPGWTGAESVLLYIDRLKDQLPDDESKTLVDALIPPAAVEMLHKRLTGRFRPIGILETGKWDTAIDKTETMITSWKDRERRGNLCGELKRLETKIANHPEFFTSYSSVRETLGLFLYRHHLLDAPSTMLENDVQLVEAAFGRIKLFGGAARTALDEPLALKATIDYFHEKDPSLVAAAERAMLHSDNPSDYCPTGAYISMVITYPAEVVNFQIVRPDPKPELEGLHRVSIDVDDNNFSKIFPSRHVEFLDKLKGHKRRSEQQQSRTSKKTKTNDPLHSDEQ